MGRADVGLSTASELEQWRWLISEEAAGWIERAARSNASLATMVDQLRKRLSAAQTHRVLDLVALRRRAVVKFDQAGKMFFTRRGLQQATDQRIATYKARRFPAGPAVADLGCGVGGDLLGLATRTDVVGIDRDPVAVLLAQSNCRACGHANVAVRPADAGQFPVQDVAAWHLDPDRRPRGQRTTRLERHEPRLEVIDSMLVRQPDAAVKLAPAAVVPAHWSAAAELEWIGHRRECQQQVAWFGALACRPGQATATVLSPLAFRSVTGRRDAELPVAGRLGRYVFEPHSAVLAAHLTGVLAVEHDLSSLDRGVPYLTGDRVIADPALTVFEVVEVLPLDFKRLKSRVRQGRIGRLEVKKRGVRCDPDAVRRRLQTDGPYQATLLLTRCDGKTVGILARRMGRHDIRRDAIPNGAS